MQNTSYFTFTIKWQNTKIHFHISRDFPKIDCGGQDTPPPLKNWQNSFLDFYSQPLKRVPVVLCLGVLLGPREKSPPPLNVWQNSLILDFYYISRDFPKIDCGGLLSNWQNSFLDFYSQPLKRVPVVLGLGALSSPAENPPLESKK